MSDTFWGRLNFLGKSRQPFLFLTDFELQRKRVWAVDDIPSDLFFAVPKFEKQPKIGQENGSQTDSPRLTHIALPSFSEFSQKFHTVQNHLKRGDTYLLNLTFPSGVYCNSSLRELFRQVKAPYKMLWEEEGFLVFSPESFVEIENNTIRTFPMKGTIAAYQPNALQCLLDDAKEQDEHATVVDLLRNDLSQVAKQVEVEQFRYAQKIETPNGQLWQTSSIIKGFLPEDWHEQIGTLFRCLLPAGSICGAPKRRTVEIIRKVEGSPRGYYTGVFGWYDGEILKSGVMIRFLRKNGKNYFYHSGVGVTHQSLAEREYSELKEKIYVPIA